MRLANRDHPYLVLAANAQPTYPLFTVNSTADAFDTNPGDGICADSENRCTLRAAVDEANSNTSNRPVITFSLSYPAVINLTLGEIHIQMADAFEYYLVGPGPRLLTVQRNPSAKQPFRIFNVTASGQNGGRLVMRGLTIKNGMGGSQFPGGGLRVGPGAIVALRKAALINNSASLGGAIASERAEQRIRRLECFGRIQFGRTGRGTLDLGPRLP